MREAVQGSITRYRAEYPALERLVRGKPPIYFDNAATALTPRPVLRAITDFLSRNGANVHRGIHYLSHEASEQFEDARDRIASFLGADTDEVVFVRNTTEAVNLVARSLPRGSKVLLTGMEHHSNVLPWRMFHETRVVPLLPDGTMDESRLLEAITDDLDLVAVCQVSNVLGIVNPVDKIVAAARDAGVQVLVDGAQGAAHLGVDFGDDGYDYYALSAHKMGGPTGIGVLCGRRERLQELEPLVYGGNMITQVHLEGHVLQEPPLRFEAGTPPIEGVLGLAAACDFLDDVGLENILEHDRALAKKAREGIAALDRTVLHGCPDPERTVGIVSFAIEGIPANMVAKVLSDRANVCVRSGWLCSQPLHEALGIEPSVRASFYLYNTEDEIDTMLAVLQDLVRTA